MRFVFRIILIKSSNYYCSIFVFEIIIYYERNDFLKELTIRYKTANELQDITSKVYDRRSRIVVLIDGEPIERLKHFSIDFDTNDMEPTYTIEQYMDYPDDPDYEL